MLTIDFCYKCKIDISRLDPENAAYFLDICTEFIEKGEPVSKATDEHTGLIFVSDRDLSKLEQNGYLVSTECSRHFILIIPQGISCDINPYGLINFRFCCKRGIHD